MLRHKVTLCYYIDWVPSKAAFCCSIKGLRLLAGCCWCQEVPMDHSCWSLDPGGGRGQPIDTSSDNSFKFQWINIKSIDKQIQFLIWSTAGSWLLDPGGGGGQPIDTSSADTFQVWMNKSYMNRQQLGMNPYINWIIAGHWMVVESQKTHAQRKQNTYLNTC